MKVQSDLVDQVDEMLDKLTNPVYEKLIYEKFLPGRKYKTKPVYKLISVILQKQGVREASPTTIWRLVKIKNEDPDLFEDIRDGKISIKTAYNKLHPVKTNAAHTSQDSNKGLNLNESSDNEYLPSEIENVQCKPKEYVLSEDLDFNEIIECTERLKNILEGADLMECPYPTEKQLRAMERNLFDAKKALRKFYDILDDYL